MASLIGFDKNRENFEFKGHCKLSINFLSNYLYVEPDNEAFKMISASFKWNYVAKNNFLFVFAEFDFLDFCLVFKNEAICKKTFDCIVSQRNNIPSQEKNSIDISFINPILQTISNNPILNSDLIKIISKWHQLLDKEDQKKYSNLIKEYGIFDLITAKIGSEKSKIRMVEKKTYKRKYPRFITDDATIEMTSFYAQTIPSSQFKLIYVPNVHHRKLFIFTSDKLEKFHHFNSKSMNDEFQCTSCKQKAFFDIADNFVKTEAKKHSCKLYTKFPTNYQTTKIIRKPNYEIFESCSRFFRNTLVIFDSDDRSLCYEYYLRKDTQNFVCLGCSSFKNRNPSDRNSKANIYNEGTETEYVEIFCQKHLCRTKIFEPANYSISYDVVFKPNFEIQQLPQNGKEWQKLFIFNEKNKTQCYQYYYRPLEGSYYCGNCHKKRKYVSAKLCQNREGVEYIILSNTKHVCEMKPYIPKILLHQNSDFEFMEITNDGIPRIFVFQKNDRTKCHVFGRTNKSSFYCVGCSSKTALNRKKKLKLIEKMVIGNLFRNDKTGHYSFQLIANRAHICELKSYQPEKYAFAPKTYDFFYFRPKNNPSSMKLAIYFPDDKKLCFQFILKEKAFICNGCARQNKRFSVKTQKDMEGKEYYNHNFKKHVCKPLLVSSIPKSEILKEHGLNFDPKPKPLPRIDDDSKVIKIPNFKLASNKTGLPDTKLILSVSTNPTLCYEYGYVKKDRVFRCNKCHSKKTNVFAKLYKNETNDAESFIVLGKREHICQPVKNQLLLL